MNTDPFGVEISETENKLNKPALSNNSLRDFLIVAAGIIYSVVHFYYKSNPETLGVAQSTEEYNMLNATLALKQMGIRIVCAIWVAWIAKKKLRSSISWGLLTLVSPFLGMIIIGLIRPASLIKGKSHADLLFTRLRKKKKLSQ